MRTNNPDSGKEITMLLAEPADIGNVIYDGVLELEDPSPEAMQRAAGPTSDPTTVAQSLPQVSIGRPEVWSIVDLYRHLGAPVPSLTQAMLDRYDLYLIRLACSFRPEHHKSRIEWARFALRLEPDSQGNQPLAEDLHPGAVETELTTHAKVVIGPALKFHTVEASIGSLEIGIEYRRLIPKISASGESEANPAWDYFRVPGHDIIGGKTMHLIVKAPRGMPAATGTIALTADVETTGGVVRSVLRHHINNTTASLPTQLWP